MVVTGGDIGGGVGVALGVGVLEFGLLHDNDPFVVAPPLCSARYRFLIGFGAGAFFVDGGSALFIAVVVGRLALHCCCCCKSVCDSKDCCCVDLKNKKNILEYLNKDD